MTTLISEMTEYIVDQTGYTGGTAIILGSGLGRFADRVNSAVTIPYKSVPHYPQTTVVGQSGEFVIGKLGAVSVIVAKGRFHLYEGHDINTVTLPIRLFHSLKVNHLIITNAAGSMRKDYPPGTLMIITGNLDCTFRTGSEPPVLCKDSAFHDPDLIGLAKKSSKEINVGLNEGVYCWAQGPAYETPAEIEYFRQLGGDAVGMSTIPEIRAASEFGIKSLGISCLTNYAAGITGKPLTHQEVIDTADRVKEQFADLLERIVVNLNPFH